MRPLLAIGGPTATGKSALAMYLAERLDGEIINADALQVYRGLDIGTAKPAPADRRRVPHHLVDILDPQETYSAGSFSRHARSAIVEIRKRGRLPLVVGGSGLYQRALIDGMSHVPEIDPAIRRSLRDEWEREGLAGLRERLARLDPGAAERLESNDSQRILRALEVILSSGQTLDHWTSSQPFGDRPLQAIRIGLTLSRSILYDRIERRIGSMLEAGWLREVTGLLAAGVKVSDPAFQAIGYRQMARHVVGDCSLDEAVETTLRSTRQFAKRQQTWYRREPRLTALDAESAVELRDLAWEFVRSEYSNSAVVNDGEEL